MGNRNIKPPHLALNALATPPSLWDVRNAFLCDHPPSYIRLMEQVNNLCKTDPDLFNNALAIIPGEPQLVRLASECGLFQIARTLVDRTGVDHPHALEGTLLAFHKIWPAANIRQQPLSIQHNFQAATRWWGVAEQQNVTRIYDSHGQLMACDVSQCFKPGDWIGHLFTAYRDYLDDLRTATSAIDEREQASSEVARLIGKIKSQAPKA
jgi:hypothetical protein